jgi:hypothetical protein
MSSASFARYAPATKAVVAAWESQDQIFWAVADAERGAGTAASPPGKGNNRKHPVVAVNQNFDVLVAWTEETGWNKGGKVAWQIFDGVKPVENLAGKVDGLPVWSLPAAFTVGYDFVILY